MKKILAIALLALFGLQAQAQIVSSRSSMIVKQKNPRNFMWTVRLGYSSDTFSGDSDVKSATGFDAGLGFTKYLNSEGERNGMFWGLEAVGMTNSAKYDVIDKNMFGFGVYGAPRVGYKMPLMDKMAVAAYVGAYVGYMFEADEEEHSYQYYSIPTTSKYGYSTYDYYYQSTYWGIEAGECVSYGLTFGAELFLNDHFFIDMHVRKSLAEDGKTYAKSYGNIIPGYHEENKLNGFKFSIGCGFQF